MAVTTRGDDAGVRTRECEARTHPWWPVSQVLGTSLLIILLLWAGGWVSPLGARQERPAKPLQVWEIVNRQVQPERGSEMSWYPLTLHVYKFQVGSARVCKAFVIQSGSSTSSATALGEVPCDE